MHISDDLLQYLETLSRLSLSAEEREAVKADLSEIIGYMQTLDTLDPALLSDAQMSSAVPFGGLPLREDRSLDSFDRSALLQNAPDKEGPYFRVPKALE